ncbi:MAG TPA: TlpA disulfide reductase family protein, partial [Treponemataceae bacterium]|nr:TlpA disulfide reductase family protein [Treponemataceae bacterium]
NDGATEEELSLYDEKSGDLSSFNALDLDGNEITAEIFSNYDITMVNIWATWCGPCVNEIPELAKLVDMIPPNVQLVSICTDADTAVDDARAILEASGATYPAIIPNEQIFNSLLKFVSAIPTTVFVDSSGKIIGEPVVGVPGEDVAAAYLNIIERLLEI